MPRTQSEINEGRTFNQNHNLETPIDWIMQDNPDIKDPNEAFKILQRNKIINNTVGTTNVQTGNSLADLIRINRTENQITNLEDIDNEREQ